MTIAFHHLLCRAPCRAPHLLPSAPAGPEPQDSGITIPVAIIAKEDGRELLRLGRQPPARAVRASLSGFEREVLTTRHSHGLTLELLPSSHTEAQRLASWYPGYNYRHSRCRVCNSHVGYFFNRTLGSARQRAVGSESDSEHLAEHSHGDAARDEQHSEHEGEPPAHGGEGTAGAADAEASTPPQVRAFHALLRDEVADSGSLRSMTATMRLAPVL